MCACFLLDVTPLHCIPCCHMQRIRPDLMMGGVRQTEGQSAAKNSIVAAAESSIVAAAESSTTAGPGAVIETCLRPEISS